MAGLTQITGPQEEPISVAEAKAHLRYAGTGEDFNIATLIVAAREWAESETHRSLVSQTWDWTLDEFPDSPADVPLSPLQSVTSISYIDEDGALQTMPPSDYSVDTASTPGRIQLADGAEWPTASDAVNAVTIRIVVGHGNAAKVMEIIKLAIKLHVEAFFDRDQNMMEKLLDAASNLLKPHTIYNIS